MSKSLKQRKNHWSNKVHESILCRNEEGELGLELKGGAERGQFPVIGQLLPARAVCHSGKVLQEDLLLEVNDTPVAGLTTRDVHAVVKHSKDPVRLKCVKQGEKLLFVFLMFNFPALASTLGSFPVLTAWIHAFMLVWRKTCWISFSHLFFFFVQFW
uniref:PDZ domain-containing protein n=1 Tax=Fundulus heteroclitus TaxID=8078 RepID=A0A3Q2SS32_FUNHE